VGVGSGVFVGEGVGVEVVPISDDPKGQQAVRRIIRQERRARDVR
jgi:hypothetical protein